jgi:hypothetical protein
MCPFNNRTFIENSPEGCLLRDTKDSDLVKQHNDTMNYTMVKWEVMGGGESYWRELMKCDNGVNTEEQ